MTDAQRLIAEYIEHGSETAFRELVDRYVNLVYSTALRLVNNDGHLAQDVVQTVFADLAGMAGTLADDVMLGGWLHRHTCFVATKTIRSERRRRFRERDAMEMNMLNQNPELNYALIAPILDEVVNELDEADRTAVLLRFYEQKKFHEIGEAVGCTEDSARMRVNRALEKLEVLIRRHGVTSSAAMLGVMLSADVVQAAPAGMAALVSASALGGGTSLGMASAKAVAMTTTQKVLLTGLLVAAAGTAVYEACHAASLRTEVQTFTQELGSETTQIKQLRNELNAVTNRLGELGAENQRLMTSPNESELLRLRGRLAVLKTAEMTGKNDSLAANAKKWLDRVNDLKAYLEKHPEEKIPEMEYLRDTRLLNAVDLSGFQPQNDKERQDYYRNAIFTLKRESENDFGVNIQVALVKFSEQNSGQSPTNLAQLKPFCSEMVESLLQRFYELEPASILPDEKMKEMQLSPDSAVVVRRKATIPNSTRDAFFAGGFTTWKAPPGFDNQ